MHHVIIGNGGAGTSALKAIRSVDAVSDVTIVSRERFPAYSPCSLPDLISGGLRGDLIFRFEPDFYEAHGARFLESAEALRIDTAARAVALASGEMVHYDTLLIAAGATPIVPRMPGMDLGGVHVMGTLDATLGIIDHLEKGVEGAAVIGGGFMGIETATNLRARGVGVTIVELLPNVLSRMLDPDVSERVEVILAAGGVDVVTGASVEAILGDDTVSGVSLSNGREMACDMVVVAIGVAPNVHLVEGAGIETGRGIVVDGAMRTNVEGVYAAGDIAEVRERITGTKGSFAIWPNAIEQGRIAGLNMAGADATYLGADVVNILDVFDVPVVAMGGTAATLGDATVMTRSTPAYMKRLHLVGGRIQGLQFVGTIRNAGPLYGLMTDGVNVGGLGERLLDDTLVIAPSVVPPERLGPKG